MSDIQSAVDAANQNFMSAFQRGDAAGVAACYTADARLLPPNGQPMNGTAAITAFWQGAMAMGITAAKLETVELETRGDLAIEIGQYTLTIQLPPEKAAPGTTITDVGKYVVVWKNDGGAWKLHVDIWNTNTPA